MGRASRPIILMAFANPRRDLSLNKETSGIRSIFRHSRDCELMILDHPSLADITETFQNYRNQIVVFHYGGHANGFQQMLESDQGEEQRINVQGFAEFLASQQNLKFVFLNGCSTEGQVKEFFDAGVECVIATTQEIDDQLATAFSLRFYKGLESGANLKTSYDEAVGSVKAISSGGETRGIRVGKDKRGLDEQIFFWQLHAQNQAALEWSFERERATRRTKRESGNAVSMQQLEKLLNFVEEYWIQGVLHKQSSEASFLHLSKVSRPDVINDPFEAVVEYSDDDQEAIGEGKLISDVFEDVRKRMLILGQPGSGKTTTLLQLTSELVDEANRDPSLPVPVVLPLSKWSGDGQSLRDWIQEQLIELYGASRKVTGQWLDNFELILLLDGLDEVSQDLRPGCVDAIHEFLDENGAPGIVVTCRLQEYSELPVQLRFGGAIHLQPLSREQILEYVDSRGQKLASLHTAIDAHEPLQQLAQSPLLLEIMCQVYEGSDEAVEKELDSLADFQSNLFGRFVDRMFKRRGRATPEYTRDETEGWLSWLANTNQDENSSMFFIELLQPSSLVKKSYQVVYCLALSLIMALLMGTTVGFFWWGTSQISADTKTAIHLGLWWWAFGILFVWFNIACVADLFLPNFAGKGDWSVRKNIFQGVVKFLFYLVAWSLLMVLPIAANGFDSVKPLLTPLALTGVLGSMLLAAAGWSHRTMLDIAPVEALTWAYWRVGLGALSGVAGGFLIWVVFRLTWPEEPQIRFAITGNSDAFYPSSRARELPSQGYMYFLVCLLILGSIVGSIVGGLARISLKAKTQANQGMINSRRNALKVGSLAGLVILITSFSLSIMQDFEGTDRTNAKCFIFSLGIGLSTFVCIGLILGGFDYLKHAVLKSILAVTKQIPWRLNLFLEYVCELSFMKRVGGGYLFLHRLLQEHFATEKDDEKQA